VIIRSASYQFQKYNICINENIILLSAVFILLPGLTFTQAIIELSTRNLISGTVRLFSALFTAMFLGFGAMLGTALVYWNTALLSSKDLLSLCEGRSFSHAYDVLLFIPLSVSLNIFFRASYEQVCDPFSKIIYMNIFALDL
jgi:hypothetical protein